MTSVWRLLVSTLALVLSQAGTTTVGAATYTYDGPAIARIEAHSFEAVSFVAAPLFWARAGSASPYVDGRRTSTTPLALVVATEAGTSIRLVGDQLESVDDVFSNPQLLQTDLADHSRVRSILEGTPGWQPGALGKGDHAGQGWTFRELNSNGTDFTDRYIQWHPGGVNPTGMVGGS